MSTANVLAADLVETFREAATCPDPDLATPALLIARLAYPRLDLEAHLAHLDGMGESAARQMSAKDGPGAPHGPIASLNRYLFDQEGFTGNSTDYEDPRNSFLNQVLARRTGIPITLAVVYIEVARRAGVRVDGVNFPGHFLLRFPFGPDEDHGGAVFVDPFHRGAVMSDTDCQVLLQQQGERAVGFEPKMLAPATKLQILIRMLSNLKRIYVGMRSFQLGLALTELRLAIEPSALSELRDRGLLAYHLNDFTTALRSLEAYLRFASRGDPVATGQDDRAEIWKHVKALRRRAASLN